MGLANTFSWKETLTEPKLRRPLPPEKTLCTSNIIIESSTLIVFNIFILKHEQKNT